ncbi:MAG: hypothetical protein J0M33_25960 [Anaerolineae bacterium]|nr:hypothetical protein [Anaerolineae bacterium]
MRSKIDYLMAPDKPGKEALPPVILWFGLFLLSVAICSLALVIGLSFLPTGNKFCSQSDPVLAVFEENASRWYPTYSATINSIRFDVEGQSRLYNAQAYGGSESPEMIYVITGDDRIGANGDEGYIFLPSDNLNYNIKYWFDNYWITRLEANYYCFRIRS